VTAILPALSPCRRHPCSLEHADVVTGFREHAARWEEEAERVTGGYGSDLETYAQSHPRPLFRDWLIHSKRAS
jgi:hypothetical protein